ncbi:MAG: hypothetical protein UEE32_00750, partial [Oscillospiraceae bacterium]|nr:hypothetical protein [Oscillospiraceae bacterium]
SYIEYSTGIGLFPQFFVGFTGRTAGENPGKNRKSHCKRKAVCGTIICNILCMKNISRILKEKGESF